MWLLLLAAGCAHGFWEEGHMLVAEIARQNVGEETRRAVDEACALSSWHECSVWPDTLKTWSSLLSALHYRDRVFGNSSTGQHGAPQAGADIQSALESCHSTLSEHRGPSSWWARNLCVRLVLHLVGDAHQPMHSCTLQNELFPDSDFGGTRFRLVRPDGSHTSLHYLFDSCGFSMTRRDADAAYLEQRAKELQKRFPRALFPPLELHATFQRALDESFALGVSEGYLNGTLQLGQQLTVAHEERVAHVVSRRVAQAGYRLAVLLEELHLPSGVAPTQNQGGVRIPVYFLAIFVALGVLVGAGASAGACYVYQRSKQRRPFEDPNMFQLEDLDELTT